MRRSARTHATTSAPRTSRPRATLALGAAAALLVGTDAGAVAQEARSIDTACRDDAQAIDHFDDVDPTGPHAGAIDCLWAYGVVQGAAGDGFEFRPGHDVTRQQMASFTANLLRALPDRTYQLPEGGEPPAEDADRIAPAHRSNVAALYETGVVAGHEDDTFRPGETIDRAQTASFVARALEEALGAELPRDEGAFDDVDGVHRESVEKLAAVGVVQGDGAGEYDPSATTTRAQMASLVARSLDHLTTEGALVPLSFGVADDGAQQVLTEVEAGEHDGFDRASITTAGDEASPGWEVRYTDEPVAAGSGQSVDVAGDAVLEVVMTGTAPPTEHDDPWDGETITIEGEGIVEVVDAGWFEGRHQVFVGTTGPNAFEVDRLTDRPGVLLDVQH